MTYLIQIDDQTREATADEIAAIEAQRAELEKIEAANASRLAQKQAVLDKLGLTADEAAALLS